MTDIVEILSYILPLIASALLLFTIITQVYIKLRQKFPAKVNCWFCNTWSSVPYRHRNSFNCPNCTQYNGFNEDGDYNRDIPEQHAITANSYKNSVISSNGLCFLCNNNQRLKVLQLANFVPMVEENYDVEIEHFQKQLETAYKLCKNCNQTLKNTLNKQNAWLFGHRLKSAYNKAMATSKKLTNKSNYSFIGIFSTSLIFIATVAVLMTDEYCVKNIAQFIPENYTEHLKTLSNTLTTVKTINLDLKSFSKSIEFDLYSVITIFGVIIQLLTLSTSQLNTINANRIMCWLILILARFLKARHNFTLQVFIVQLSCCMYLIYTAISQEKAQKTTQKHFTPTVNVSFDSDFSDNEDIHIEKTLPKKAPKTRRSKSSPKTNLSNESFLSAKSSFRKLNSNQCQSGSKPASSYYSSYSKGPRQDFPTGYDLNNGFHNLTLGNEDIPIRMVSPVLSTSHTVRSDRFKPVLSPGRLNLVDWKAVDDWRLDGSQNDSRGSSVSSGIGSQNESPVESANNSWHAHLFNQSERSLPPTSCFQPMAMRACSSMFNAVPPYKGSKSRFNQSAITEFHF